MQPPTLQMRKYHTTTACPHYQPRAKETTIWHDVHKKFEHVAQLKMKLVADYEEKLPPVTDLECGHFHKRSKRWIESAHDLEAMYKLFAVNDE